MSSKTDLADAFIAFWKTQGVKFVDENGEEITTVKKHNTLKGGKNYES